MQIMKICYVSGIILHPFYYSRIAIFLWNFNNHTIQLI